MPEVPGEDWAALPLADPCDGGATWSLFRCEDGRTSDFLDAREVPLDLHRLLSSAERFPPALALARGRAPMRHPRDGSQSGQARCPGGHTHQEFSNRLGPILEDLLAAQASSPYFIARSVKGASMMLFKEWFWIVGFNEEDGLVNWVSHDFFVYQDPADCFDLPTHELKSLLESDLNIRPRQRRRKGGCTGSPSKSPKPTD